MAETCTLELADPPLELDFETLRSAPLEVFFVLGYRPALAPEVVLVAAVGEATPGERQPLVWAKLDPFAQRVRQIGWFTPGERWNPLQVFAPLLQGLGEDVPALLLLSEQLDDAQRPVFAARVLAACGLPAERAAAEAERLLASDTLWPGLRELLADWQAAAEASAFPPDFDVEAFRTFLTDSLVASLWWPPPPGEAEDGPGPDEWAPASAHEVRVYLHGGDWRQLDGAALLNVLRHSLMLYGKEVNERDILPLAELYTHVAAHSTAAERCTLAGEIAGYAAQHIVHPVALLPMVVKDSDPAVVASASAQLLALSPRSEAGERYAYAELRELFRHRGVANPGSVFAALIAAADEDDWGVLGELGALLAAEHLQDAAAQAAAAGSRRYWLAWSARLTAADGSLRQAVQRALAKLPPASGH